MKDKKKKSSKKEKVKYIKFCPKCSSIEINRDKSTMQSLGYLPTKYICDNCGYSSFNFPEIEIEKINELKIKSKESDKNNLKSELIDTSYGKFIVRGYWKIFGPLSLMLGLFFYIFHFIQKYVNYLQMQYYVVRTLKKLQHLHY